MLTKFIEIIKSGAAIGFSIALGMFIFICMVAGVILIVIVIIRKVADWQYKRGTRK